MQQEQAALGRVIKDFGLISQTQLEEALNTQKRSGKRLGEVLLDLGYVSEEEYLNVLGQHLGIPRVRLSQIKLNGLTRSLPLSLIQTHQVLPLEKKRDQLILAMVDPFNVLALEELSLAFNCKVVPVLISQRDFAAVLPQVVSLGLRDGLESTVQSLIADSELQLSEEKIRNSTAAPEIEPLMVKLVNGIISQGVLHRASDIHLEPAEKELRIRYRIDGILEGIMTLPKLVHGAIVSRLKIMADLDIAERRLPQDGRIRLSFAERELDLRMATLPTIFGEKVMLRILDRPEAIPKVEGLDIRGANLAKFKKITSRSSGLILVCGPTGSGKTTTLYSILNSLNDIHRNTITLEDPVECVLPGVNQVQINPKGGFDFASGLRSVLRQDPDIIMVGEIRDKPTAELAVQAALTGHLVLSTLHTRSAAGAVMRLIDMGIEPLLLMSSLIGVIAQRLVRKVCTECRTEAALAAETKIRLGLPGQEVQFMRGTGCSWCNYSGYWGRMAIQEILVVNSEMQSLIEAGSSELALARAAEAQGMKTLWQDGLEKAAQGETTIEEILRAVDQD